MYEIQMHRSVDIKAFVPTGAYAYNGTRGWIFVQRVCFWILDRLRCQYCAEAVVDVETHLINPPTFAQKMMEADEEIWNRTGRRPRKIYVGSDDYAQMMKDDLRPSGPMQFNIKLREGCTSFNVPVEVIPWMSGFLVI